VEDDEDYEILYSVAYQKIEDEPSEVSDAISCERFENNLEDYSNKTLKNGRPFKVCGGKIKG
jgi:hypothetical protein